MRRFTDYLLLFAAGLIGYGSLTLFVFFLFFGALHLTPPLTHEGGALLLDAVVSLAFFAQHSGMVRNSYRRWFCRFFPEPYDRAFYAISSGVVLLLVIVLWQGTSPLLVVNGFPRWLLRALFWSSIGGFVWGILALKSFDPCGLQPIICRLRDEVPVPPSFTLRGPYHWVRHPLYSFMILIIWSSPDVTADRLLFNLLWTAWIVAGAFLEERDLVDEFGDVYRQYQRQVPMLVPYRFAAARLGRRHET